MHDSLVRAAFTHLIKPVFDWTDAVPSQSAQEFLQKVVAYHKLKEFWGFDQLFQVGVSGFGQFVLRSSKESIVSF